MTRPLCAEERVRNSQRARQPASVVSETRTFQTERAPCATTHPDAHDARRSKPRFSFPDSGDAKEDARELDGLRSLSRVLRKTALYA